MALLGLASVFGFSGYLLPMDELSYFATKVGLEIPAAIPLIGPTIANMLRGGPDVSEFTVQRFFALHVVVLPALFLPLLGFHLWLVQKHGNAVPPSEEAKPRASARTMPFMPNFLRKDLAMWLISLNILALLASVFPWELGKQFDPLAPAPMGIHPEWYFMSPFEMLKLLGTVLAWCSRRDCRHSAVHHRHCAVGSDSVLRLDERHRGNADAPRIISASVAVCPAAGYDRYRLLDYSVSRRESENELSVLGYSALSARAG